MWVEVCWLGHNANYALLDRIWFGFDSISHVDIHLLQQTTALIPVQNCKGSSLTRVRGDVYVVSLRRLSVAVALSSPQADTQILSRKSLAQCLTVHHYQVQCHTEASVCAPSSSH